VDETRVVDVALPLPLQAAFSYCVPDGLPLPERGCRVVAPFGPRRVIGVVAGRPPVAPGRVLKDLFDVLDEVPLVAPPLLDLAAWMADYYLAAPGECYRLVLPPAGLRASRAVVRLADPESQVRGARADASCDAEDPVIAALRAGPLRVSVLARRLGRDPSARLLRLRRDGRVVLEQDLETPGFRMLRVALLERPEHAPAGRAQAAVLERLRLGGGRLPVPELLRDHPSWRGALERLVALGAVRIVEERELRTPEVAGGDAKMRPEATSDQARALSRLQPAVRDFGFRPFLLHGVTGSGKTEIYFRAVEQALRAGRGALVLVPEIALTPLLLRAATARFGPTVSVLHSDLSVGERHDQWWRIRDGEARVVVGTRSAVFAPLADPGLIVVDEEHESAYKQEDSPRYHARDVAVMRARLEGVPVVLGSATPSVESYANALKGKYERIGLPERVTVRGLPRVEIVDRREVLKSGGDPILTPPLLEALRQRLARGEQALLLLNRRGYATSLLCRECGVQAECPNCSVTLTLHQGGRVAMCHYCGHLVRTPSACAACRGEYLRLSGYGTERVVDAVAAAFPQARVARLDRDLAGRRGAVTEVLTAFEAGRTDVLVGTQMIAKGHDFPRVTLVGVVDADVGLGLPDFRAAERAFQLLTQVAGRAGRGEIEGEVILQSHLPDHYALQLACTQDYAAFFAHEMEFRRTMAYPPAAALVNLVLRSKDAAEGAEHADALARALRASAGRRFRVLGPARAPLARLREEHRFQVLLKGDRAAMRSAVRGALVARFGSVRWPGVAVDVDPVSVM
jgi:primosomal protein N' (replication factor Y)